MFILSTLKALTISFRYDKSQLIKCVWACAYNTVRPLSLWTRRMRLQNDLPGKLKGKPAADAHRTEHSVAFFVDWIFQTSAKIEINFLSVVARNVFPVKLNLARKPNRSQIVCMQSKCVLFRISPVFYFNFDRFSLPLLSLFLADTFDNGPFALPFCPP